MQPATRKTAQISLAVYEGFFLFNGIAAALNSFHPAVRGAAAPVFAVPLYPCMPPGVVALLARLRIVLRHTASVFLCHVMSFWRHVVPLPAVRDSGFNSYIRYGALFGLPLQAASLFGFRQGYEGRIPPLSLINLAVFTFERLDLLDDLGRISRDNSELGHVFAYHTA